jgi:hypothetical protein
VLGYVFNKSVGSGRRYGYGYGYGRPAARSAAAAAPSGRHRVPDQRLDEDSSVKTSR